jgi:ABC-type oligopeptide transport system substrate-binding subunit
VRARLWSGLFAVTAGVIVLGSASVARPSGEANRGGTLRLMFGAEPSSVDPALADPSRGAWAILFATCAKLFNTSYDGRTGEAQVVPEVVQKFDVSSDGRTYTFQLRRTFRFHTGAPVTAQSFADAFNRDANSRLTSPSRRFLDEILGAGAVIQGKTDTVAGVRVLGPYRLQIRLTRPAGDLPARLTMPFFCPLLPNTPMQPIEDPPGSGPYYIAERVPNRRMVLERNPYYGGARPANPDRIVWTIEPDPDTRVRATEQDENDYTPLFSYPDPVLHGLVSKYGLNRPGGQLFQEPLLSTYLFVFNPERPAFKAAGHESLQKAINFAVDRSALGRPHGYLAGTPTDRLLPPALSDTRPAYPLGRADPVTARKWLARDAHRPKTLVLYTTNFPFGAPNAQAFASSLKRLGIDVVVKYFEFSTMLQKLRVPGEPWDVAWLPWNSWYLDPAGSLVLLFRTTRFQARVYAANRVTGAARQKAWADLEADLMRNDPPVAAYMNPADLVLLSRSFGCYRPHIVYDLDLAAACKK